MDEGKRQPDKQPRPEDATVIGEDASATRERAAGPMPETIEGYRIKRPIGAGGMGSVYLAQQESPRRNVAIKIMNPGVVSSKALRRFEFEAQTLGKLQHPSIAQIYEAGTYDDGSGARPYFAMEYVSSGKELGDYVSHKSLDTKQRLELFRTACEGIEYGHRRGVIHRDLKPGNILVDIEGRPKIIDFGVARSTESDSVNATLATEAGQLIGTLQYMSPEQVELDPSDLDTRSDVYALGVILFQLLTDQLPYDLSGVSLTKAGRLINEMQPKRLGDIKANLKGDLETICLKALEKDRNRRYQSIGDLSEDLRRYLEDEPILARPPTKAEQFHRLIRKNKTASIAAAVVAFALIAATVVSILFAFEAGRQRDAAEFARKQAEEKTRSLETVTNFQTDQISGIDITMMGSSLRRNILDVFDGDAKRLDGIDFTGIALELINDHILERTLELIGTELEDQPLVRAELLQTIASTRVGLGLAKQALAPQKEALAIRLEQLSRDDPDSIRSIGAMGILLRALGQFEDATPYYEEALASSRTKWGENDPRTLSAANNMVRLLHSQGEFEQAESLCENTLDARRIILGDEHADTLKSNFTLGVILHSQLRYDEAMPRYAETLEIRRAKLGNRNALTLFTINAMGVLLKDQGKFVEAEPYFTEALDGFRQVLGDEHFNTIWSVEMMGFLLKEQGKFAEARPYFEEWLSSRRKTSGPTHPLTVKAITGLRDLHAQWHEAEPDAGHDAIAERYKSQLDAASGQHTE
ncbi:MAG: hypothetical protein CMJ24_06150 [Phycisphaerae bacterium]|nr:hypothetical protein [Phycisphaerae bacterium]